MARFGKYINGCCPGFGIFPNRRDMKQQQRRESANVRRLAAQLGISARVLHDDDGSPTRAQQEQSPHSQPATRSTVEEHNNYATSSASPKQSVGRVLPPVHGDDDDELEESLDQCELDSGELPDTLVLASDSNSLSASESVSSELSLPRSFGHYDGVRVAVGGAPAAAASTRRRSPFSGISHFDDHLMHFPTGPARQIKDGAAVGSHVPPVSASALPTHAGSDGATPGSDVMKKFYEVQVEKVRSQLVLTTQAQRQLEKTLQDERAAWSSKIDNAEHEHETEKRRLEHENAAVKTELQSAKKRLKLEKSHFASLQISDALAEQLSRQDESDLSIREFIQLTVHRKMSKLEADLEAARKDLEELQRVCSTYKTSASAAHDEIAQVQRVADTKQMRLHHELEQATATREEMERQITALCTKIEAMKEEQRKNDAFASNRISLQDELDQLKVQVNDKENAHNLLYLQYEDLQRKHEELERRAALLSADKNFLQEAKAHLEEHETLLLKKQRDLEAKIMDLQSKLEANVSQSIHLQNETRLHFEKKMDDEVSKFMELSKQEIERIRNSSQIVYERENRLLKEARDDALKQLELLQRKLDQTLSSLEEKVLEITRMESGHTTSLASLRNDLKMKHFEMNQLKMSLEEQMTNSRASRLEIEMLEQKVQVHREEFAKLESTSTTRITQLESALEVERNKLKEYEQLEVDLDAAVIQTGAILGHRDAHSDQKGDENSGDKLNQVMTTFGAIPSSTKRRFQQSVSLAQRVVKFQRESIEFQQKLKEAVFERSQLETEVKQLKTQLANIHQPQSYLIEKINRKEIELKQARHTSSQLEHQVLDLRKELATVLDAKMSLQKQLQQVLARREDLDTLKSSVYFLRQKLLEKALQSPIQHRTTIAPQHIDRAQQHGEENSLKSPSIPSQDGPTATDKLTISTNEMLPASLVKVSLPPSVMSKMTEPPPPANQQQPSPTKSRQEAELRYRQVVEDGVATMTPPKWYTKLRASHESNIY